MHRTIAWDDLRLVLAVAEQGSLAAAARVLGVNHTTVLRRVNAVEAAQGVRLFERLPGGVALTAAGEEVRDAARAMAEAAAAIERRLAGRDLRLAGSLRVTTTDTLMAAVLPGILADFRAAHPDVTVEVSTAHAVANLTRRDADVAIRPSRDPPEILVGRRVAGIAFARYARAADAPGWRGAAADPPWLGLDDSLAATALGRWLRGMPGARVVLRADSLLALAQAAAAGLGVAPLPCYLGDATPGLARLDPAPLAEVESALWVLTHPDLRRTARVRAFTDFAARALAQRRALFEGTGGPAS